MIFPVIKLTFYRVFTVLIFHMFGEYVLGSRIFYKSLMSRGWNFIINSLLYVLPFGLYFTINLKLLILFIAHLGVDILCNKIFNAQYNSKISDPLEQVLHVVFACIIYHI